jgi:8-oxo-dGTP pyrophosphatase MutT (NUDIX family)
MSEKFSVSSTFLTAAAPLTPQHSVAAILVNAAGEFLLQLRDNREDIFFPHHWGCFGGAIDDGETLLQSLHRELHEELNLTIDAADITPSVTIRFSPRADSAAMIDRYYFIVPITQEAIATMRLGEGSDWKFFAPEAIMGIENATPYDKFALWLHLNEARLPHTATTANPSAENSDTPK